MGRSLPACRPRGNSERREPATLRGGWGSPLQVRAGQQTEGRHPSAALHCARLQSFGLSADNQPVRKSGLTGLDARKVDAGSQAGEVHHENTRAGSRMS